MKEIVLKSDVINYLQRERVRVANIHPKYLSDVRVPEFVNGYKEGYLDALQRVINALWTNNF